MSDAEWAVCEPLLPHPASIFPVVYLLARGMLGCLMIRPRREASKDAEPARRDAGAGPPQGAVIIFYNHVEA
jgi:hypothetical protein